MLRGGTVRHRHHDANIGELAIGGERLAAVNHPLIAVEGAFEYSARARSAGVGAGLGLGQRPGPDPFSRSKFRNVAPALFVVARDVNMVRAQRNVRGDAERHGGIDAG